MVCRIPTPWHHEFNDNLYVILISLLTNLLICHRNLAYFCLFHPQECFAENKRRPHRMYTQRYIEKAQPERTVELAMPYVESGRPSDLAFVFNLKCHLLIHCGVLVVEHSTKKQREGRSNLLKAISKSILNCGTFTYPVGSPLVAIGCTSCLRLSDHAN